ncbi:MAG: tetratricopeptide repeat protein [Bacteroidetes bacterium]|nr:tetratricopeptide repeat protein [Bacteroidota bacterium]
MAKKPNIQSRKISNNTTQSKLPPPVNHVTPLIERPAFLIFIIIVLTFFAFSPSLQNGFILTWDDSAYILNNQTIQHFNSSSISEIFTTTVAGSYVPLPLFTFAIEYRIFGLNPFIFHLSNLFLHLLCTVLVFLLLKKLRLKPLFAGIGSLIFALHPMHVESVVWLSERKDLLYSLFYFSSLLVYIRYIELPRKRYLFYFTSLFLFLLSLFSKITAVTLPIVLLFIDYYLDRSFKKKVLIEKIPFLVLSLIFGFTEIVLLRNQEFLQTPQNISLLDQIFLGFYSLDAYVIKFFIPFQLSAIYPYGNSLGHDLSIIYYISPFFAFFLGFLIYKWRKNRVILFGIVFFLINIIPMFQAQIVTQGIGFLADRFSYLPYLGLCLITGWFCEHYLWNKNELKQLSFGGFTLIFIIMMFITFNRTKVWKDDMTLWNDVIEKYPNEIVKSYANRGIAYTKQGKWNDAITDFTKVIEMDPQYSWGYSDRGVAYQNTSQWEKSLDDFSKAIALNKNDSDAFLSRGVSYGVLRNYRMAIEDFSKTIELTPKNSKAYSNRGLTYMNLGFVDSAIKDYSKAIELNRGYRDAFVNRSIAYSKINQLDKAISDCSAAIELDQGNAGLYNILGYFYFEKGDIDKANKQFQSCLNIDARNFEALLGLSTIFYLNRDKDNAYKYLDQAISIEPRLGNGMDGIAELENIGYFKSPYQKEVLKKMFYERR